MFKVETNITEFKEGLKAKLHELIDVDKVLREAALDTVAVVSERVQQHGKKTDGSPIKSGSNSVKGYKSKKTGKVYSKKRRGAEEIDLNTPYSEGYARRRVKKGLQIERIDETYTGDMMGDFIAAPDGKTGYVVGFRGQLSSDKADWNEMRFGTIFQLSESEANFIQEKVKTKINAILNRPS
jgi:hypothetical protein